jgi:two-component system cell cycle sensor histidine kinase/response regulator CckA
MFPRVGFAALRRHRVMSYKSLFDSNPLPIWVISRQDFRFLQTNPAATELFGFTADEFKKMTLADLHTPAEMECFQQALDREDYRGGELCGWRGRTKSGETLDLELKIQPVKTHEGPALIVIPLDVRERLGLEQQIRQAQKMEAVGMLAGGIAHDFNNLLTIISGYTQMLLAGRTLDEGDRPALEQILKASDRAADLTAQLLNFSRRQNTQMKVLSLNAVVTGMSKMVRRLIGEHIDLRIQLRDDAGMIRVDSGKAEQVILNLVVNSRDALSKGGKLTITTRREDLNPEVASALRLRPGRYAVLTVNDTGSGMDTKVRERVFEPFFTTKEQGTGLGLSTVYGIVKQANGSIQLWSEKGVGTSIDVYFPRLDEEVPAEAVVEPEPAATGKETILIVEDEEAVRRLMSAALEQNGYRVLIAADGAEALKLIASHTGPLDLLVTDLLMPGMNGAELTRKVKDRLPDLKVLCISGYAEELRQSGEIDESAFLQKPFTPQALLRKVRDMLDRHDLRTENHKSTA